MFGGEYSDYRWGKGTVYKSTPLNLIEPFHNWCHTIDAFVTLLNLKLSRLWLSFSPQLVYYAVPEHPRTIMGGQSQEN